MKSKIGQYDAHIEMAKSYYHFLGDLKSAKMAMADAANWSIKEITALEEETMKSKM